MIICAALFLAGIIFVRLTSTVLTEWDPFGLIAQYSERKNISIIDINNDYYNLYFQIMCSFFSVIYIFTHLGIHFPPGAPPKNMQKAVDATFAFLLIFSLQILFIYARYCIAMVLLASVMGMFWAVVMVSVVKFVKKYCGEKEIRRMTRPCAKCCARRQRDNELNNAVPLTRANLFVY